MLDNDGPTIHIDAALLRHGDMIVCAAPDGAWGLFDYYGPYCGEVLAGVGDTYFATGWPRFIVAGECRCDALNAMIGKRHGELKAVGQAMHEIAPDAFERNRVVVTARMAAS